eukprot:758066-Hanusia_phi.AAC.4
MGSHDTPRLAGYSGDGDDDSIVVLRRAFLLPGARRSDSGGRKSGSTRALQKQHRPPADLPRASASWG